MLGTYIGRTTTDAMAVTGKTGGKSYRFWYFAIVTTVVVLGLYLVTVAQPFILWTGVALASIVYRSIGSLQIIQLNNTRLHPEFRVSKLNFWLLWFSVVSGLLSIVGWLILVFPGEACKQAGFLC